MRILWELKKQIRNKTIFFWTGIFPLVLSVLFSLVLKGAYSSDVIQVNVAVVADANDAEAENMLYALQAVTYQGKPLYDVAMADNKAALKLLEDGEVSGIIVLHDGELEVLLEKNGFSQTLITEFVHRYEVNRHLVISAIQSGMDAAEAVHLLEQKFSVSLVPTTQKDPGALHFFTLIGMVCMYGGFYGIQTMRHLNANMSSRALRVCASSYPKYKMILSNFIVNNLILDTYVTVDILFMRYALGIDFGESLVYVFLLAYLGCFAGNGFGLVLGGIFPNMGADVRDGLLVTVSMLFSFFSGMMSIAVKQMVMQYLPAMTYINPCYLISDGLYALFYYGANQRYFHNLMLLLIFGLISTAIGLSMSRRQQYDEL